MHASFAFTFSERRDVHDPKLADRQLMVSFIIHGDGYAGNEVRHSRAEFRGDIPHPELRVP